MPSVDLISSSPVRKLLFPSDIPPMLHPYGGSTAFNILDYFLGTPEIATKVLFLGSGDLRNALYMATQSSEAYHELDIHMSDSCDSITARNFLIANVIFSEYFDPEIPSDMQYLWDLWYGSQWNEATRKQFVSNVLQLLSNLLTSSSVIPHGTKFKEKLRDILSSWLDTACNMTVTQTKKIVQQRLQFIQDSGDISFDDVDAVAAIKKRNSSKASVNLSDIAILLSYKMGVTSEASPSRTSLSDEIEIFLRKGDFEPKSDPIVCFNPTLLSMDQKLLQVPFLTSPLDAYFPLSLNEKLNGEYVPGRSAYKYCIAKLQEFVTELKEQEDCNRFHFYFGDSLELCLTNDQLKNNMHVIHCSTDIVNVAGLANLLPIASGCLTSDIPEAVLVMEVNSSRRSKEKPSLVDHIESELCCPLTIIPTVYGMKLWDHVNLGSSVCCKLHDYYKIAVPITLKWYKAPIAYSKDVRLEVSPALKKVVSGLVDYCFHQSHSLFYSLKANEAFHALYLHNKIQGNRALKRYTPLTLYNILQPFFHRHNWVEGATESLIQQCLPARFQLAWRTLKDWIEGKEVLLFYNNSNKMRDVLRSAKILCTDLGLVKIVLKPIVTESHYNLGRAVSKNFFNDAHCVFNLNWKDSSADDFAVSFLLAKDHGLDSTTHLLILDSESQTLLHFTSLTSQALRPKLVVNPNPSRRSFSPSNVSNPVYSLRCQESEDEYTLDVGMRKAKFRSPKDLELSTEGTYATHCLELKFLSRVEETLSRLKVSLPWPINVHGIESALLDSPNRIRIIAKKCIDDAWPGDYGGRSKWDINRLRPWKDLGKNENLKNHIEAQFDCCSFYMSRRCMKIPSPLTPLCEVRDTIRAIFYSHYQNKFQLMAVTGPSNPDHPVFFFRLHPPVRFSPHGSPLLLVSVIDYSRLKELIIQGKVDWDEFQSDYHRLITERVSKDVCVIRASTDAELLVLRYVLRVNSTRMRRSAWQSKNLPRGQDTPWICTFLTPLYSETITNTCGPLTDQVLKKKYIFPFRTITCPPSNALFRKSCAYCYVVKVQLKSCAVCNTIYYCSTYCQRSHWYLHRKDCVNRLLNS